jgi:hypothetical protein
VHSLVSTDQLTGNSISQLFLTSMPGLLSNGQLTADCCPRLASLYTLLRQQVHSLVSTDQLTATHTSHPLFSSSTSMSGLVSTDQLTATPDQPAFIIFFNIYGV